MNVLFRLFIEFFTTGLLAFGGGMATLPFLYDMGDRTGWFTSKDVLQMLAVSESTPGPIGVNMATYVGFTVLSGYGIFGAVFGGLFTTLSLVLPSVIVILIISRILKRFKDSPVVAAVFVAIRPASLALITSAGLGVLYSTLLIIPEGATFASVFESFWSIFDIKAIALGIVLFIGMLFLKKVHPIFFIIASAVVGIILGM